ncbi:hypothetical protein [Burkholderia ambifaria]|jgi:hypothetical protein|uniref:hypothetical protein n=1 Tax=Burkholderia ambifaria TaxID=152480 RepID=UPI00158AB627|nr:hypothetical protein [Burkholderia ambifaria]
MKLTSARSHPESDPPVTADRYHIIVEREQVDDEWQFVGRVREFPDVEVYEASKVAAYEAAYSVICSLLESYHVHHIRPPSPAR